MFKFLATVLFSFLFISGYTQEMTVSKLGSIINEVADNATQNHSKWNFKINEISLMVIADSTHNRMRIISPISHSSNISDELKTTALMANFHTALDIKYAIADDILWSAFIHPLKELSKEQVIDAISQVYYGNVNFGTTFSSSSLLFPGRKKQNKPKENDSQKMMEKI